MCQSVFVLLSQSLLTALTLLQAQLGLSTVTVQPVHTSSCHNTTHPSLSFTNKHPFVYEKCPLRDSVMENRNNTQMWVLVGFIELSLYVCVCKKQKRPYLTKPIHRALFCCSVKRLSSVLDWLYVMCTLSRNPTLPTILEHIHCTEPTYTHNRVWKGHTSQINIFLGGWGVESNALGHNLDCLIHPNTLIYCGWKATCGHELDSRYFFSLKKIKITV